MDSDNSSNLKVSYDTYDYDSDIGHNSVERVAVACVFCFIFTVGIIGNGTLIYTVLRNRKMRVVPNIYIVSLSLGDLLLILISVPFNGLLFILPEWPFGEVMCKINEYLQTVSLGVSVFTLTALSADRYIAIVDPMAKHKSRMIVRAGTTAGCLWVVSLLLGIPDFYTSSVLQASENVTLFSLQICLLYPTHRYDGHLPELYPKVMVMVKFFVFFVIPLIIIGIFYVLMARILILSAKQIPGDSNGKSNCKKQIETRMKVAKSVLTFVFLFGICWLPRHIYLIWVYYMDQFLDEFWLAFKFVSFCMAFSNSCVNPFALYFLSNQFRKYYNRYLFCMCTRKRYDVVNTPNSSVMYNFQSTVNSTTCYDHSQTAC
ncbi:neuropeptide CCHamide-1 receptor-like [Argonauta hians]